MGKVHLFFQQIFIRYLYVRGTLLCTGKTRQESLSSGIYMLKRRDMQETNKEVKDMMCRKVASVI